MASLFLLLRKKNSFRISEISSKDFCKSSLCPKDYRELIQLNSNTTKLSVILDDWYKGAEIGSDNYMKKSSYRFLKTNNVTSNYYYDQN